MARGDDISRMLVYWPLPPRPELPGAAIVSLKHTFKAANELAHAGYTPIKPRHMHDDDTMMRDIYYGMTCFAAKLHRSASALPPVSQQHGDALPCRAVLMILICHGFTDGPATSCSDCSFLLRYMMSHGAIYDYIF